MKLESPQAGAEDADGSATENTATLRRIIAESDLSTNTSSTFPMMPTQDAEDWPENTKHSDNPDEITEEHPRSNEGIPQNATSWLTYWRSGMRP